MGLLDKIASFVKERYCRAWGCEQPPPPPEQPRVETSWEDCQFVDNGSDEVPQIGECRKRQDIYLAPTTITSSELPDAGADVSVSSYQSITRTPEFVIKKD